MIALLGLAALGWAATLPDPHQSSQGSNQATLILVRGAPGQPDYEKEWDEWLSLWEKAGKQGDCRILSVGRTVVPNQSDKDQIQALLTNESRTTDNPLWIVFLGHGTDDGKECRFNLVGPDLTPADLAHWLQPVKRPVALLFFCSSSAPFIKAVSGPGRVVITATRSGAESNLSRFGGFFARALHEPRADLDQDGQVSLLEAFLFANSTLTDFYKGAGRLATEHPLLDDNGDGLGVQGDWFQGLTQTKKPKEGALADGRRAHQWHLVPSQTDRMLAPELRRKRDNLEIELAQLREKKSTIDPQVYERDLEALLRKMGSIYLDSSSGTSSGSRLPAAPAGEPGKLKLGN